MTPASNRRRPVLVLSGSAGYSLVEVIVAMLISCIMVTAVMGVAVTSKQGGAKAMHRMMFNQGIAQLSAEVKQYVTACGCIKSTGVCPAPDCTQILGPNTNAAGVATWYINGAAGATASGLAGTITDSQLNVWALSCGNHTITGVVPTLEAAPYLGSITYNVTYPIGGCNGNPPTATDVPTVTYTASWTEP
jgi:Tfp pilus assembly protein PilV